MPTLDDILALPSGATFRNADLHVHSFGGSDDVTDSSMTVEAIVDAAVANGISVIAITDHNSDVNVARAGAYASAFSDAVLVVAGCEVSTANGHLLVYFDPEADGVVRNFLARIEIVGRLGSRDSHTRKSMADVITEATALGGICVAAHIDRAKTGFEAMVEGYPTWKKDIVCSAGLSGFELDDAANLVWYSPEDDLGRAGAERKKFLQARGAPTQRLAHVQNSDAHSMTDFIGQTSSRTLTKLKMDQLTFEAFQTAFADPEARIRAVASVPRSFPRVLGVHFQGGFLDDQAYHFSDNLNCVIGGRGAGKSTAIEGLAYGTGIRDAFAERGSCPEAVTVYCEDANGIRYAYERTQEFGTNAFAIQGSRRKEVPVEAFRIEFYGQGDIGAVAKDPLTNAQMLQDFLDRHILLSDLVEREGELIQELQQNSSQLIPLESSAGQLDSKNLKLGGINKQLKAAEDGKVREFAAFQIRLAGEKALCDSLSDVAESYNAGLSLSNFLRSYDALQEAAGDVTEAKACQALLQQCQEILTGVNKLLGEYEAKINAELKDNSKRLQEAVRAIESLHTELEKRVAFKRAELSGRGLSGTIEELNQLIKQRTRLSTEVTKITSQQSQLEMLRNRRKELLGEVERTRAQIIDRRKAQLKTINKNLQSTIPDYSIYFHYDYSGIIEEYKDLILTVMHGSFFQEDTAEAFCRATSPQAVVDLVRARDVAGLATAGLDSHWAEQLITRFQTLTELHKLETVWKSPRPAIKVLTKTSPQKLIPVNQLSDGQKHTIFLTVAMLAESNVPLLIDQPEDDLDNEFISTVVVSTLRSIKERRQVIVVTHNANIAVLGDAELIIPLRRDGDNGKASRLGSIDNSETRRQVQQILEGGAQAFERRMKIYGY